MNGHHCHSAGKNFQFKQKKLFRLEQLPADLWEGSMFASQKALENKTAERAVSLPLHVEIVQPRSSNWITNMLLDHKLYLSFIFPLLRNFIFKFEWEANFFLFMFRNCLLSEIMRPNLTPSSSLSNTICSRLAQWWFCMRTEPVHLWEPFCLKVSKARVAENSFLLQQPRSDNQCQTVYWLFTTLLLVFKTAVSHDNRQRVASQKCQRVSSCAFKIAWILIPVSREQIEQSAHI